MMATSSTAGAYVNPSDYGSGTTMAQGIADFNNLTSRTITSHRTYFGVGNIPSAITADLQADAAAGRRAMISLKPAYNPPTSADRTALGTFLASCTNAGLDAIIALWHEPYSQGLTVSQYTTMINYYAATVRTYYPLAFCQSTYPIASGKTTAGAYYPGDSVTDQVVVDYYCDSYLLTANTLTLCANVADAHSKPFGIWEYNKNSTNQTNTQVTNFMTADATNSILAVFQARVTAAKPVSDVLWFQNSAQSNAPAILSATDFRVPLYQQIFDLITGIVPPAPPSPGNLLMSMAPAAGTDPYGNAYPAGLYMPGLFITADSWHSLTYQSGWTGNGYYRHLPNGDLELSGTANGSTPNSAGTIAVLPGGYHPSKNPCYATVLQTSGAYTDPGVELDTSGNLIFSSTAGSGSAVFRLDGVTLAITRP